MTEIASPQLSGLIKTFNRADYHGYLLWLDPGETTGYALMRRNTEGVYLVECGQIQTWPLEFAVHNISGLLTTKVNKVGFESYHIYGWKLQEHKFQEVPPIQVIGCLKTLCIQKSIPTIVQNAQTGKAFCTDENLKKWNLYIPGQVHARDAIRHACQYLLFGIKGEGGE